jgi:Protein of unknown function (DUF3293)
MQAKISPATRNIQSMTPELRESFRKARYQLHLPAGTAELAVDQPCTPLGAWLGANGCTCAALLTAFNPGGRLRDASLNMAAQLELESRLAGGGFSLIQGIALDPTGNWPPEPSVLAARLSSGDAMIIARDFGQAAFLWCDVDAIPRLMETDQASR